jgi:hypothetical protein
MVRRGVNNILRKLENKRLYGKSGLGSGKNI